MPIWFPLSGGPGKALQCPQEPAPGNHSSCPAHILPGPPPCTSSSPVCGARQDACPLAWVAPPYYLQLSCSHLRTGQELPVGAVGSHRLDIWVPLCLFRTPPPRVSWDPHMIPTSGNPMVALSAPSVLGLVS